jgi:hypothetical protein
MILPSRPLDRTSNKSTYQHKGGSGHGNEEAGGKEGGTEKSSNEKSTGEKSDSEKGGEKASQDIQILPREMSLRRRLLPEFRA